VVVAGLFASSPEGLKSVRRHFPYQLPDKKADHLPPVNEQLIHFSSSPDFSQLQHAVVLMNNGQQYEILLSHESHF
jgi:hypothetical protein